MKYTPIGILCSIFLLGFIQKTNSSTSSVPFEDCRIFSIGGSIGQEKTYEEPFYPGATLSFFPFLEDRKSFKIHIAFPKALYKIMVEGGKRVEVQNCNEYGYMCNIQGGNQHIVTYVESNMWNKIVAKIENNKILLLLGGQQITINSMKEHLDEVNEAKWFFVYMSEPKKSTTKKDKKKDDQDHKQTLYQVQYMCLDYIKKNDIDIDEMNNTHYESHTVAPHAEGNRSFSQTNIVLLIAGVVIASILLIGVSYFVYKTFKARKSAAITENSKLQTTQK